MTSLIGLLMFTTLGAVMAFAYVDARMTRKMKGKTRPSTLCRTSPHWEKAAREAGMRA